MADTVVLDPAFRRLENIFTPEDLARQFSSTSDASGVWTGSSSCIAMPK